MLLVTIIITVNVSFTIEPIILLTTVSHNAHHQQCHHHHLHNYLTRDERRIGWVLAQL